MENPDYEVWYTESDDPNAELKMKKFKGLETIEHLCWWFSHVRELNNYEGEIKFIRRAY